MADDAGGSEKERGRRRHRSAHAFGNGLELIDAIVGLDPEVPIIAVSGTGPELLGTAKMIGACATLPKPVNPTDLVGMVDEAINSVSVGDRD